MHCCLSDEGGSEIVKGGGREGEIENEGEAVHQLDCGQGVGRVVGRFILDTCRKPACSQHTVWQHLLCNMSEKLCMYVCVQVCIDVEGVEIKDRIQ